ncbi:unnamed protein product [Chilo suppressalis]|uniref:Uncharacterized protein n=1 Tax=Chilo suppressalis TaxID=168631 RepID=A0ABN8AXR7_CHISP|nr:unnamed protein product [Chilo suppressalis]
MVIKSKAKIAGTAVINCHTNHPQLAGLQKCLFTPFLKDPRLQEGENTYGKDIYTHPKKKGSQDIPCVTLAETRNRNCDEEGSIAVERKNRKPTRRNLCNVAPIGPNNLLRPVIPVTLLYVSRLHYITKAEGIAEYLRTKTNFSLRVARLESCHDVNFNSFVVRVPTEHLTTFLKEELWPKGMVFRRFKGRLPDTTPRHTSPTKCVISYLC